MTTDPRDGFTPGPWRANTDIVEERYLVAPVRAAASTEEAPYGVAEAYGDTVQEVIANARLIASAPTLLADNERLRKRVADLEEMLDEADDELWLTYPNGETNTPAANLRERIRAALALAGQKRNEHGT